GIKFSVQARTQKKGSKVEVVMDSIKKQGIGKNKNPMAFKASYSEHMAGYLEYSGQEHEGALAKVKLNEIQRLKEVKIRAAKAPVQRVHNLNGPDHYDQLVKGEDMAICPNLS